MYLYETVEHVSKRGYLWLQLQHVMDRSPECGSLGWASVFVGLHSFVPGSGMCIARGRLYSTVNNVTFVCLFSI